jgi:hypothetical protein
MSDGINNLNQSIDSVRKRFKKRQLAPKRLLTRKEVDYNADKIMRRLGYDQQFRAFLCKALYRIPLGRIYELVDIALEKGENPAKYFSTLLSIEFDMEQQNDTT